MRLRNGGTAAMAERRGWIRRALDEHEPVAPGHGATLPARSAEKPAAIAGGPARSTTIERGCEIEGNLSVPGPLVVLGDFRGSIECGDLVTVGLVGSVQAGIRARSVVILGSVVGDVEARRDVILHAGARLHGDVKTPSLVIERGAFFNGRTEMAPPLPRRPHAVAEETAQAKLSAS